MEQTVCNSNQPCGTHAKDFFTNLTDTSDWPPRWHCGNWSDFHGWLYILSDLLIWGAYFAIPIMLIYFIQKKKNIPFTKIFWLFSGFILLCGSTHLIDAIIFYYPVYRINALMLFATAVFSWLTIVALYKLIPQALLLKTPVQLEVIVAERTQEVQEKNMALERKSEQLKNAYEDLESKVKFRTLDLERTIIQLQAEIASLKQTSK